MIDFSFGPFSVLAPLRYICVYHINTLYILAKNMCDCEKEYFLCQQRAQNMIEDDQMFMGRNRLNEHGFEMPTLPNVTYDMMSDDNFMVRKLDEIIVGGGGHVHIKHLSDESNVEIHMFN